MSHSQVAAGPLRYDLCSSLEQQKNVTGDRPGGMAVWILIFAELTEFGLFFTVYLIAKAHNVTLFQQGSSGLNTAAGVSNTVILLTSSYFVARAMAAIKSDDKKQSIKWLYLTLLAGFSYCGVKAWEYAWNGQAGISSRTDIFYTLYYYLTFNHLIHVLIGMCTISWVILRSYNNAYDAAEHEGLESAAYYWHMIDLVWILIFPLLYVVR